MSTYKIIEATGMILSTGWFDMGTFIGGPGCEHKEDIVSATKAAASGGFSEIAVLPNTNLEKRAEVYLKKISFYTIISLFLLKTELLKTFRN